MDIPFATIINIAMFFVNLFVSDKIRQQEIKDNMTAWFNSRTSKGAEINDQVTDIEDQEEDLDKEKDDTNG